MECLFCKRTDGRTFNLYDRFGAAPNSIRDDFVEFFGLEINQYLNDEYDFLCNQCMNMIEWFTRFKRVLLEIIVKPRTKYDHCQILGQYDFKRFNECLFYPEDIRRSGTPYLTSSRPPTPLGFHFRTYPHPFDEELGKQLLEKQKKDKKKVKKPPNVDVQDNEGSGRSESDDDDKQNDEEVKAIFGKRGHPRRLRSTKSSQRRIPTPKPRERATESENVRRSGTPYTASSRSSTPGSCLTESHFDEGPEYDQGKKKKGGSGRSEADDEEVKAILRRKRGHGWTHRKRSRSAKSNPSRMSTRERATESEDLRRSGTPYPASSRSSTPGSCLLRSHSVPFDEGREKQFEYGQWLENKRKGRSDTDDEVKSILGRKRGHGWTHRKRSRSATSTESRSTPKHATERQQKQKENYLFHCQIEDCGLAIYDLEVFTMHLVEEHKVFACYSCEICYLKFTTEEHLKIHSSTHQRTYHLCPRCLEKFFSFESFQAHEKRHLSVSANCKYCDLSFIGRKKLYAHMEKVHWKGPQRRVRNRRLHHLIRYQLYNTDKYYKELIEKEKQKTKEFDSNFQTKHFDSKVQILQINDIFTNTNTNACSSHMINLTIPISHQDQIISGVSDILSQCCETKETENIKSKKLCPTNVTETVETYLLENITPEPNVTLTDNAENSCPIAGKIILETKDKNLGLDLNTKITPEEENQSLAKENTYQEPISEAVFPKIINYEVDLGVTDSLAESPDLDASVCSTVETDDKQMSKEDAIQEENQNLFANEKENPDTEIDLFEESAQQNLPVVNDESEEFQAGTKHNSLETNTENLSLELNTKSTPGTENQPSGDNPLSAKQSKCQKSVAEASDNKVDLGLPDNLAEIPDLNVETSTRSSIVTKDNEEAVIQTARITENQKSCANEKGNLESLDNKMDGVPQNLPVVIDASCSIQTATTLHFESEELSVGIETNGNLSLESSTKSNLIEENQPTEDNKRTYLDEILTDALCEKTCQEPVSDDAFSEVINYEVDIRVTDDCAESQELNFEESLSSSTKTKDNEMSEEAVPKTANIQENQKLCANEKENLESLGTKTNLLEESAQQNLPGFNDKSCFIETVTKLHSEAEELTTERKNIILEKNKENTKSNPDEENPSSGDNEKTYLDKILNDALCDLASENISDAAFPEDINCKVNVGLTDSSLESRGLNFDASTSSSTETKDNKISEEAVPQTANIEENKKSCANEKRNSESTDTKDSFVEESAQQNNESCCTQTSTKLHSQAETLLASTPVRESIDSSSSEFEFHNTAKSKKPLNKKRTRRKKNGGGLLDRLLSQEAQNALTSKWERRKLLANQHAQELSQQESTEDISKEKKSDIQTKTSKVQDVKKTADCLDINKRAEISKPKSRTRKQAQSKKHVVCPDITTNDEKSNQIIDDLQKDIFNTEQTDSNPPNQKRKRKGSSESYGMPVTAEDTFPECLKVESEEIATQSTSKKVKKARKRHKSPCY